MSLSAETGFVHPGGDARVLARDIRPAQREADLRVPPLHEAGGLEEGRMVLLGIEPGR